jgi:DNA polymerase-3 subunit epsilon
MMGANLSLRLRVFLFFCVLGLGGGAVSIAALWLGYVRAAAPEFLDAFVFSGSLILFGLLGLTAGIWLLFDENVAKPIERLAADLRARAHAGVTSEIETGPARYLGDLAPAAQAMAGQLSDSTLNIAQVVATQTAQLAAEKARLTALLTDIPIAMIIANPDHQIVLYDGQAASVLAQIAPPRLNASLFEYFQREALQTAYSKLCRTGKEVTCVATGADNAQSYDLRLQPLGDATGYMLIIDESRARISPVDARPLVYDFDLLSTAGDTAFEHKRINDLCFVVFDTETTGLLPHKDEIVQIGAVRVLKGRIIESETLDILVNPGKAIPPAATRVHRITDVMVRDAPDISVAAKVFHGFANDAVIVAHNAPFDMAFLRRHADRSRVRWDHPILDTVLLSAVLFGASQTHTLDALCDRLAVEIPPALRHTALGDAQATAEVLCKMLPMLSAGGLQTFGDVIAETRKYGRLLEDLN